MVRLTTLLVFCWLTTWLTTALCWAQPTTKLPVSIHYSIPPSSAHVLEGFIEEFRKEHPDLDITTKNFAQPEDLYVSLTSGKEPPTIALMETSWLPSVSRAQPKLLSVESWMPREQFLFNWSVKCNTFIPLWDASHVDGKLMALPYFFTTRVLLFNADVMARSGAKAMPNTWDQFAAIALKMADPKNANRALALGLSASNSTDAPARNLQIFNWQFGGEGLTGASAASSDANTKTVEFLTKLQPALAPLDGSPGTAPVATWLGDIEDYFALKAQGIPVKTHMIPGSTKENRLTEMQAWSLGIFQTFPENQLYKVQELGFFLLDFPQQLRWAQRTPYLAAHVKVFDNPFYRQERIADHANLRVFLNSVGKARLVDTTVVSRERFRQVSKDLVAVLRGEKNLMELLTPH